MPSRAAIRIISRASNATLSMSRNEFMTPEQNSESKSPPQIPMGPPEGPASLATAIFWNDREFRAGWRLLIYLLFFVLLDLAETFVLMAVHFPLLARTGFTANGMLVQEGVGVMAALGAATIMGMLEGRPVGFYGLPRAAAFSARFWQGGAWGITMIAAIIVLIRAFHGYSFGELALRGPALWGYAVLW